MKNVRKPEGEEGIKTLERMNKEHTSLSLWGISHIDINKNDTVLDAGCGGGINLKRLQQLAADGVTYGIDYSDVSVGKSEEVNRDLIDDGKIVVKQADVQDLPFEDNFFDVVTAFETTYFWPNLVNSFKEIRRVLKKNGKFAIILATNGDENNPHLQEVEKQVDMHVYNSVELRELLEMAGFEKITTYIRKLADHKEEIQIYNESGYDKKIVDDTFTDDDPDDGHHVYEWVCIVSENI